MSIFPEDKHLEVYMKSNKEPEKGLSSTTIIFISASISITFSLALFEELFGIENTFNFHPSPPVVPSPSPISPPYVPIVPSNNPSIETLPSEDIVYGIPFDPYRIFIVPNCNGVDVIGADFRIQPSTADSVIKGIILPDQWVSLTGRTTYADGLIWYEAINESNLEPSANQNANDQLFELQTGWIQDCFVREAGYPA